MIGGRIRRNVLPTLASAEEGEAMNMKVKMTVKVTTHGKISKNQRMSLQLMPVLNTSGRRVRINLRDRFESFDYILPSSKVVDFSSAPLPLPRVG
jgi:hypothetical protein